MLDKRQLFKVGFLHCCAKEGLTVEETRARIKRASEKLAGIGDLLMTPYNAAVNAASGAAGTLGSLAVGGAIAAPLVAGGLGGYALSHALDADEVDAEQARKQDYIAQLRVLTQQARHSSELRRKRHAQARPYNRM